MSESAVLPSLVESLYQEKLPPAGRLSGQRIVLKRKGCSAWICLDNKDSIHFLLAPAPPDHSRFRRLKMRLLSFGAQEWIISREKERSYTDVTCRASRKSPLRRPFLSFCEDAIRDLEKSSATPDESIYRTALRWQRFWSPEPASVSDEWIYGLGAELIFLRDLIKSHSSIVVGSWTGPDGRDQDFQANGIGIEVKATTTQPPTLTVSNLNQLDHTLFDSLYLVVFAISPSSRGNALPTLVQEIEHLLCNDETIRDLFWKRLNSVGYRRHLEERYNETCFTVNRVTAYPVNSSFPKLTAKSLRKPLDSRIRDVRYCVRISGLTGNELSGAPFKRALNKLAA